MWQANSTSHKYKKRLLIWYLFYALARKFTLTRGLVVQWKDSSSTRYAAWLGDANEMRGTPSPFFVFPCLRLAAICGRAAAPCSIPGQPSLIFFIYCILFTPYQDWWSRRDSWANVPSLSLYPIAHETKLSILPNLSSFGWRVRIRREKYQDSRIGIPCPMHNPIEKIIQ